MTNHEWTTALLPQITIADMAAMTPIGTIEMTETAGAPIVMMIAVEAMVHEMMTAVGEVIMVPGVMTAEDMSIGIMIVAALVTNATTTMMMIVIAGRLLPEIAIEVMWITGTGIGMKDHGALLVRQKVRANMGGINR